MRIIILITILVSLCSCSEKNTTNDITNPEANYIVEGKIIQNALPVLHASVQLKKNDLTVFETVTDTNGYYKISGVPADKFVLVAAKEYSSGKFVSIPIECEVKGDITLETLILPEPVTLFPPTIVGASTITLKWSSYSLPNFYEYRLYRHDNSGLDETTGTLIHVATTSLDTTFTDLSLSRTTRYFYRLYVNNNYGKLAGSNIIDTLTNTWNNEENFTVFYNVTESTQIPGSGGIINGVDYDGEYLWILDVKLYGGYYDTNEVKILKYDFNSGQVVDEFIYNDEYIIPVSLTVWGGSIYVFYDNLSVGRIKKISKSTGVVEGVYSVEAGVQDMAVLDDTLYLTYPTAMIQKIALPTFFVCDNITVPTEWEGIVYGIACRSGEIWLSGRFQEQSIILNNMGDHIGVVDLNGSFGHLCFMQNKIVVAREAGIYIYEIYQ